MNAEESRVATLLLGKVNNGTTCDGAEIWLRAYRTLQEAVAVRQNQYTPLPLRIAAVASSAKLKRTAKAAHLD
jgi:hypothetical protein